MSDGLGGRLKERAAIGALVLLRFAVRYALPVYSVRKALWHSIIAPRLAWRAHPYLASTIFGATVSGVSNDVIQRYIYLFGSWEPHVTNVIRERLTAGDTFIDVGANIGYFSLLASKVVGSHGRVVAIEASSRMYAQLRANLDRNRSLNVRSVHAAVSDRSGVLKLFLPPDFNSGLGSVVRETSNYEEVPAGPLDQWLTDEDCRRVRLIKIDVEGAEAMVAEGMRPLLGRLPADAEILIEVNPDVDGVSDRVHAVFTSAGFHAYALPEDTLDGYFHRRLKTEIKRLSGAIVQRTDVLYSRAGVNSPSEPAAPQNP